MSMAVIYWSGTGNTQTMAEAIASAAGAELFEVTAITAVKAAEYDKLALGCPATGSESLEENDFEPFFEELKGSLNGKKIALFGSYGWGGGEWMRTWQQSAQEAGAVLCAEPVIALEAPDDAALAECDALGKALAAC